MAAQIVVDPDRRIGELDLLEYATHPNATACSGSTGRSPLASVRLENRTAAVRRTVNEVAMDSRFRTLTEQGLLWASR